MRLPKRRLKDVKKAEVIEHDRPIKALQNKTFTDNVAMNIALKDSARDKLMPTLKPYMLVGHPSHVGGSINIMQIGKKKQMMYDAEYDRTGKNLGYALNQLASYSNCLAPASLPSWISSVHWPTAIIFAPVNWWFTPSIPFKQEHPSLLRDGSSLLLRIRDKVIRDFDFLVHFYLEHNIIFCIFATDNILLLSQRLCKKRIIY